MSMSIFGILHTHGNVSKRLAAYSYKAWDQTIKPHKKQHVLCKVCNHIRISKMNSDGRDAAGRWGLG
jgi:hypothetical protein